MELMRFRGPGLVQKPSFDIGINFLTTEHKLFFITEPCLPYAKYCILSVSIESIYSANSILRFSFKYFYIPIYFSCDS